VLVKAAPLDPALVEDHHRLRNRYSKAGPSRRV